MLTRRLDGGGIDSPSGPSRPPESPGDPGLLDYAWVLSRHRRIILGIPAVAALLTFLLSFALPTRWTAEAGFIPESNSSIQLPSGLGALAGELGFALPRSDPMASPDFYVAVVESRSLLEQTLRTRFPLPARARSDSAPLIDILAIEHEDPRKRLENAVEWLRDHSSAQVDANTGVVTLEVELPDPELTAAVASRMVALLNEFNQRTRSLRARERRKFVEGRAEEAQRDLLAAEEVLRAFLSRNREFMNSPQLLFEHGRLERQVQLRQDVYQTLRREYEVARIDEVNDTPVLTVVDPAVPPAEPSSPRRVRMTLVAIVLGLLLGTVIAFMREYLSRSRELQPDAYERLARTWRRRDSTASGRRPAPPQVAEPTRR